MRDAREVIRELRAEEPRLHGPSSGTPQQWRIEFDVLDWLVDAVRPGDRTLETGCGYSTIVFAAIGARHTVVSPLPGEHERVLAWCAARGISVGGLELVARPSHEVLPAMDASPLDLVLIDGEHAFPWPFLDWFYTAERLRLGGHVVVDDTQLRTGAILRDFLAAEEGRWALAGEFRRAVAFRKIAPRVLEGVWWGSQPWGAKPIPRRRLARFWSALGR